MYFITYELATTILMFLKMGNFDSSNLSAMYRQFFKIKLKGRVEDLRGRVEDLPNNTLFSIASTGIICL